MTIVSFSKGLGAFNAITQIQRSEQARSVSIAKISSSLKIRKAADAVADSAIGTKIKVEVESLKQILVGTSQAQSVLEIAEGALSEQTSVLTRLNTLAQNSINGSNTASDREKIDLEYQELMKEIDRIADSANFNSKKILNGTNTITNDTFDELREDFLGVGGKNAIGNQKFGGGFDSIELDPDSDVRLIAVTYDQNTRQLRVTNKETGEFEDVTLMRDKIAEGDTEKVKFTSMDVTIRLNSNFDKNRSIGPDYIEPGNSANAENNPKLRNEIATGLEYKYATFPIIVATKADVDNCVQFTLLNAGGADVGAATLPVSAKGAGEEFPGIGQELKDSEGLGTNLNTLLGKATIAKDVATLSFENNDYANGIKITTASLDTDAAKDPGTTPSIESVTSFKITKVDKDGIATFELKGKIDNNNTDNNKEIIPFTATGTMKLKTTDAPGANDVNTLPTDVHPNFFDTDYSAKILRGGVESTIKPNEYVTKDGKVKTNDQQLVTGATGEMVKNYRTQESVTVKSISGKAGDLNDFALRLTGTNENAKFVIRADDGNFESQPFSFTAESKEEKANAGKLALNENEPTDVVLTRNYSKDGEESRTDTITLRVNFGNVNKIDTNKDSAPVGDKGIVSNGLKKDYKGLDNVYTNADGVIANLKELKNVVAFQKESMSLANFNFQVGTGTTDEHTINLAIESTTAKSLNIKDTNVLTVEAAKIASKKVQEAIDKVQIQRSKVAVTDNRIGFAQNNINTSITNSQAAASAIFDLDVPSEIAELSQTELKQTAAIESLSKDMRSKQNLQKLF